MKKLLPTIFTFFIFMTSFSQTNFFGMTSSGGDGFGTIFSTDGTGNNHQVLGKFRPNNPGVNSYSERLCKAPNGKYYGTTSYGGTYEAGVIYEFDNSNNTYSAKVNFNGVDGGYSSNSLMLASNGKLYGMTIEGGLTNRGVIFEYDYITNTYTKKIDLVNYDVANPRGTLVQGTNGKLYGTTSRGGTNDIGVIFEYDYNANVFSKKLDFDSVNGSTPVGTMIDVSNGSLYGMTAAGGINDQGVIYEYNYTSNIYTKKIDLYSPDGGSPDGSLIVGSNGKLYGTTMHGGSLNNGVLFEYDHTANTYSKKYDFIHSSGDLPMRSLLQAIDGKLYGMTRSGGQFSAGVIYEFDYSSNVYTKKYDFNTINEGAPSGAFIQASTGKLLGLSEGGSADSGILFEFDYTTNTYTKKIDFGYAINGGTPYSSLTRASNGKLYGYTTYGGASNNGVLFEFDPINNTYSKKFDFGQANGVNPNGSLIQATNGKLYGMTTGVGPNNGVIFEYDYNTNTYTKKIDLNNTNLSNPTGSMLLASNGKLYGMTFWGEGNSEGSIFEYDYNTNTFVKKLDLDHHPEGSLIQAPNGKLYGLTGLTETSLGTIFEYDFTTNIYSAKIDFSSVNGYNPVGSLILASNGNFYGMTIYGGTNDKGILFEYDYTSNILTEKINFSSVLGESPNASLMLASNNKLYGMTRDGGAYGKGVMFEYDYLTNNYLKKIDFNGINGSGPIQNNLIEVDITTGVIDLIENNTLQVFPNPNNGMFIIQGTNKGAYEIVNELGQTIQSFEISSSNNFSTKIKNLKNGIYFIVGKHENSITKQKIVVN